MAQSAQKCADIQWEMSAKLRKAVAKGDEQAATEARNTMWEAVYEIHRQ